MQARLALISAIFLALAALAAPARCGATAGAGAEASAGRIHLTPQEKAWLAEHPVVRVGGPRAFPPFHYYQANGQPVGIATDYVALIARRLGLRVEYQPAKPWPQVLEAVKQRELDLIACAAASSDREHYLAYSRPYLSFPMVIITRRDANFVGGLEDLHGKSVALLDDTPTGQWLRRDGVEVINHPVTKPLEGLRAVSLGQAQAYIENLAAASYLVQKHGLNNLKIAAPTGWGDYQLFFAVRNDWPQLAMLLNKALATLQPAELSLIRNKWISVRYEHGIQAGDIAKWGGLALGAAALVFLLLYMHNSRLRREIVERKAAEQERERVIGQLEAALGEVKTLSGLLPICASCKKIRDDNGYWQQVEQYIQEHSTAEFSHSICPDCLKALYPEIARRQEVGEALQKARQRQIGK